MRYRASPTCAAASRSRATTRESASPLVHRLPQSRCTLTHLPVYRRSTKRLQFTFFIAELLGRSESGAASADQAAVLRLLTPVAKLTNARQCVAKRSEIV